MKKKKKETSSCANEQKDKKESKEDEEKKPESDEYIYGDFSTLDEDMLGNFLDISKKDAIVATIKRLAIHGRDLKTLEYPPMNSSYAAEKEGELNDIILVSYLNLMATSAKDKGIIVLPYDTNFFTRLSTILNKPNSNQMKEMVRW
jgi:hypothetical protein